MSRALACRGDVLPPVGIVDLDQAAQPPAVVVLRHHLQQLMLHTPRSPVLRTEMTHELERGDPVLLLREEEHCQEPRRQGELGGDEDRPGGDRGLMVAVTTLQQFARAQPHRLGRMPAGRAHEPLRPAPAVQRVRTLRLVAVLPHEISQTKTFLRLGRVLWHGVDPCGAPGDRLRPAGAQKPRLLTLVNNQVSA